MRGPKTGLLIDGYSGVDAFDRARVLVAHHERDEVRRGAEGAHSGGEGAAQVVAARLRSVGYPRRLPGS